MVLEAVVALVLASVPTSGAITWREQATVSADVITLGAAADLSRLPPSLRSSAATLVLWRAPKVGSRVVFSSRSAAARARALMPALAPWLDGDNGVSISIVRGAAPQSVPAAIACVTATKPLAAGEIVLAGDFASTGVCAARPALAYDPRRGLTRASRALAAGDAIPAPIAPLPVVAPGQSTMLNIVVGPVRVQREVRVLQAGRPGGQVFVDAQDGPAFAVKIETRP